MADYATENMNATLTLRTGHTKVTGDTLQGNAIVIAKNAGASPHTFKLVPYSTTYHGAALADWSISIAAGATEVFRADKVFADPATNKIIVYIGESTETEVTYFLVNINA